MMLGKQPISSLSSRVSFWQKLNFVCMDVRFMTLPTEGMRSVLLWSQFSMGVQKMGLFIL